MILPGKLNPENDFISNLGGAYSHKFIKELLAELKGVLVLEKELGFLTTMVLIV